MYGLDIDERAFQLAYFAVLMKARQYHKFILKKQVQHHIHAIVESNGIKIPKMLKDAFDKLYAYTNQKDTGIRHALMDNDGTYVPTSDEAMFMLVSCSAFINYLGKKAK